MAGDVNIDEAVARLRGEIEEWMAEHVVGVAYVNEETLAHLVDLAERRVQDGLGPEFTVRALNPRIINGKTIGWDGFLIERRFDR